MVQKIIDYLHGKKAILLAISFAVFQVLAANAVISPLAAAIGQSVFLALGVTADAATQKMGVSSNLTQPK